MSVMAFTANLKPRDVNCEAGTYYEATEVQGCICENDILGDQLVCTTTELEKECTENRLGIWKPSSERCFDEGHAGEEGFECDEELPS